jgi:ATP-dependent Zn protease
MSSKRKIAIVCALLICIAGFLWIAATGKRPLTTYTYSQFLDQVRNGQVASVLIIGSTSGTTDVTFQLKDGEAARTVLPSEYKDALRAMQEKLVNIEIRGSSSEPRGFLISASPFFLLLGTWIVLMIWKFPNSVRRTPVP